MALDFKSTKGKAVKNSHEAYTYRDGEQAVRMVGGILPRYVYWVKGTNGKQIPVECLAFDREEEKFNNKDVDVVQDYHPDLKCSWAYAVNCIDPTDGKVKVLNLKKKLFEQILSAAEQLGLDPTDQDEGFDIVFKKVKTGTAAFNVEYTLLQLKLKKRALTEVERVAVSEALSIDAKIPRATTVEVTALMERLAKGNSDETDTDSHDGVDKEAVSDLS